MYDDYYINKGFSVKDFYDKSKTSNNIGLQALINQDGYRLDGSYQYAKAAQDSSHRTNVKLVITKQLESIRNNGDFSEYGQQISFSTVNSLKNSLRLCKENGIYVIGLFVPRPTLIYQELVNKNYKYNKMVNELPIEIGKAFSENGFSFYDFSDIQVLNADDNEFIDWIHPSDKMYLRMSIYMAAHDKQFNKYVNINKLKDLLLNTKGDMLKI